MWLESTNPALNNPGIRRLQLKGGSLQGEQGGGGKQEKN